MRQKKFEPAGVINYHESTNAVFLRTPNHQQMYGSYLAMLLTSTEISILRDALAGLLVDPAPDGTRIEQLQRLNWLGRDDLKYAEGSLVTGITAAFTIQGAFAIEQLADNLRLRSLSIQRAASAPVFRRWLAQSCKALSIFQNSTDAATIADQISNEVDAWLSSFQKPRTHFVPCAIIEEPSESFRIGPTQFVHRTRFNPAEYGIQDDAGITRYSELLDQMDKRDANWIAVVSTTGTELERSIAAADAIVDVALGIVRLLFGPGRNFRNVCRTSGASRPSRSCSISTFGGGTEISTSWIQSGFGVTGESFSGHITKNKILLQKMGGIFQAYADGSSLLPSLDEAWCNAVFWYHDALSSSSEAIVAVKLETALEILFRAENSRGSASRIHRGFAAIRGLSEVDLINDRSSTTVRDLVKSITEARSRILHGTLPTLFAEMPTVRGGTFLSLGDIESITRTFLIDYADYLIEYKNFKNENDDIDSFFSWINVHRNGNETKP